MKGFRDFILRGNVVDLAVGVVIGAAFSALTAAFGTAFLKPLIAIFVGTPSCDLTTGKTCTGARFTIHGQPFLYGDFVTAVVTFALTAAVVYFAVVRPLNALVKRYKVQPEPTAPTKVCPECVSNIPLAASRCLYCTAKQPAARQSERSE